MPVLLPVHSYDEESIFLFVYSSFRFVLFLLLGKFVLARLFLCLSLSGPVVLVECCHSSSSPCCLGRSLDILVIPLVALPSLPHQPLVVGQFDNETTAQLLLLLSIYSHIFFLPSLAILLCSFGFYVVIIEFICKDRFGCAP